MNDPLDHAISRAYLDGLGEALVAMADTHRDVVLGFSIPESRYERAWVELRGKLERRHDTPPPDAVFARARASYAAAKGTTVVTGTGPPQPPPQVLEPGMRLP